MVVQSGWSGQYGKQVILSHGPNSLSTHYAHLSEFFVRPGEIVRRGQVIGRAGGTGRATSPHLHYEVRYKGTPVNPYRYLQKTPPQAVTFQFAD
jgi:murein DD-endopeptidase MepM/ murein hydrolase activator NlpD